MRYIVLSDHAGGQAAEAARPRMENFIRQHEGYKSTVETLNDEIRARRKKIEDAKAEKRYLDMAGGFIYDMVASLPEVGPAPRLDQTSDEETRWRAGQEGEIRLLNSMNRLGQLSDELTVIQGYIGPRGEVDFVVVGPFGVLAVEVKNVSGTVHVIGDSWTRTRGRNGDQHEALQDRTGRNPGRQLRESAQPLRQLLRIAMLDSDRVRHAVVFSNPNALLDVCGASLDFVGSVPAFRDFMLELAAASHKYGLPERERLERLIAPQDVEPSAIPDSVPDKAPEVERISVEPLSPGKAFVKNAKTVVLATGAIAVGAFQIIRSFSD
ncbi:nuclease-related domain-containing protein [Variovorax sp. YR752]|uniref:nuclease-related domain-containing protein n=1 Tax=Variovorax sp. YR752 TaxID=1884383 RepID=UPI00313802D2